MNKQIRRLKELAGQVSNIGTKTDICSITKQFVESEIPENLERTPSGAFTDMSPGTFEGGDFINYQGHRLLWWFRGRDPAYEAKESPSAMPRDDIFPVGYRPSDWLKNKTRNAAGQSVTYDENGNEVTLEKQNAYIRTLDFQKVHEYGAGMTGKTIKQDKELALTQLNKHHPDILPDYLYAQFMTEMGLGDKVKNKAADVGKSSTGDEKSSDKDISANSGIGTAKAAKAKGISDPSIQSYQKELIAAGVPLPKYGADGRWGSETSSASKNPKAKAINQKYAGKIKQLSGIKESSELEAMLRIAGLR
jgi:hypothetical protein